MTDVVLHKLTKRFGATRAVRDLSFSVTPGVTGFLGPNGAGKTTTLRMLLGLVRPTEGTATIGGRRYAELPQPRRIVGAMLDTTGFHPGRTARQHLRISAEASGLPAARIPAVLDVVELPDGRIRGFSLGMRQRLGLATALLGDPEVLILDEPGNGLDPAGLAWLRRLLRTKADEGRTVLISSHILAEVAQIADRVVIMAEGVLRHAGELDEESLESEFLRLTGSAS